MVKIKKGNILCASENIIAHQVNCQGKMGSGVASAIKTKYPEVYKEYNKLCKSMSPESLLGIYQIVNVDGKKIINMFSQLNYGYDGNRYTNYIYFTMCFSLVLRKFNNTKNNDIAIPYKIGCYRGGGDWESILKYIELVAQDYSGDVIIYKI